MLRPSFRASTFARRAVTSGLANIARPQQAFGIRGLASTMASNQEWLILLPDREGMLEKRIEVRPTHLKNIAPDVKSGKLMLGGATLAKPLQPGEPPAMTGSVLIRVADTKEDVVEWLKNDIYGTSGVWDLENAQIIPMRTAVRKGMPDLGTEP